jgi:hypothetical protein
MRGTAVLAVIALLMGVYYCTREESPEGESRYPVREEKIDGVRTVMNPDYPRDGRILYRMSDTITYGDEAGPEEGILFLAYDIRVDTVGNAYVIDSEDIAIKVYDVNGDWIRNIGRRGQGPGEYTTIFDYDVTEEGLIFLLDTPQRRVSILRSDGTFHSSFVIEEYCVHLRVSETGHVFFQQHVSMPNPGSAVIKIMDMSLKRTDFKGENLKEYGTFPHQKVVWRSRKTRRGTGIQPHSSRDDYTTVWIPAKDGRLYMGYSRDYIITVMDRNGKPLFRFGREFAKIKNPEYSPDLAHPEYYPAFYSRYLFFDDAGNLWLKQYTKEKEPEHIYDVFSPDGFYIQQAIVPERIFRYKNGYVYTIKLVSFEDRETEAKRLRLIKGETKGH